MAVGQLIQAEPGCSAPVQLITAVNYVIFCSAVRSNHFVEAKVLTNIFLMEDGNLKDILTPAAPIPHTVNGTFHSNNKKIYFLNPSLENSIPLAL